MLAFLGLLTGLAGPIAQATASIADLLKAKANAKSNTDIADINRQLEEAHDKRAILVAMAGNRFTATLAAIMAFGFALGPMLYTLKYYGYDKVYGSLFGCAGSHPVRSADFCATFITDPLEPTMASVLIAAVGFYLFYNWKNAK